MAFFSLILVLFPFLAAMIGFVVFMYFLIGVSTLTSGITGIVLNKLYVRHTGKEKGLINRYWNIGNIIIGLILMLLPVGYTLYVIIGHFFLAN